jgi:hypothetical protein
VRSVVLLLLVSALLLPPTPAKAGQLSLYGPFDPRREPHVVRPETTSSISSGGAFAGCGRGRYRDPSTHQCRGPADVTGHMTH